MQSIYEKNLIRTIIKNEEIKRLLIKIPKLEDDITNLMIKKIKILSLHSNNLTPIISNRIQKLEQKILNKKNTLKRLKAKERILHGA
jgi:CRISPR/Cas system-associated protein Csx1